jgi:exonuclease-1
MGVPGLLPALKDVARPAHVSTFAGASVAVDAYSWLHKGSYSCARELCEGLPTMA